MRRKTLGGGDCGQIRPVLAILRGKIEARTAGKTRRPGTLYLAMRAQ